MKEVVQEHIITHITSLLINLRTTTNGKAESDVIYKHLKILVRWYAQVDFNGKDSYDYKKSDPLKVVSVFGATTKLLQLLNDIVNYWKKKDTSSLFKILSNEYRLAGCENAIPELSTYLNRIKQLRRREINHMIAPLVFYEHMTPSDVVVKEIIRSKTAKIRKDYYVLMIKKDQQMKLDLKYKSTGTAVQRLKFINDKKANKKSVDTFFKKVEEL